MDEVTQFHITNGYIVKVESLGSRAGCTAHYPENRFMHTPSINRTYIIYTDPCSIEVYTVRNQEAISTDVYEALIVNARLLVIQDIFLTANMIGMSKDLIVTSSGKTLFQMLEISMTDEEKESETELCFAFRRMLAGEVVASNIEGYAQILSCFENGGL